MKTRVPARWYQLSSEEVLKLYEGRLAGLSIEEANLRLEKYGYNEVEVKKKKSPLLLFLKQFQHPLI